MNTRSVRIAVISGIAFASLNVYAACYELVTIGCCDFLRAADCIPGGCPAGTACCDQVEINPTYNLGRPADAGKPGQTTLLPGTPPIVECTFRKAFCQLPANICFMANSPSTPDCSQHALSGASCTGPADPCPPQGCDE